MLETAYRFVGPVLAVEFVLFQPELDERPEMPLRTSHDLGDMG